MREKANEPCEECGGTGVCRPCKGSGRSGWFHTARWKGSRPCPWCKGSGRCEQCGGSGKTGATFRPYIQVVGSLQRPASAIAAITGAPWRFIEIPEDVLKRDEEAQRGWVSW